MNTLEDDLELEKELVELGLEEKEIAAYKRVEKLSSIMANKRPDLTYWSKMAYWSHDEAVALLLNKDPDIVNLSILEEEQWPPLPMDVVCDCLKVKKLVFRAFEAQELKERNAPEIFLKWAENRGIEVPDALRQAVSINRNIAANSMTKIDTETLLKTKEEEIAVLQKRIEELKTLAWEGFNEDLDTYSKELAIAVKAHGVISKNWKPGRSIKKQITVWLEKNYPMLMNEEKERIAKICNWQKTGGAPSTPHH